MADANALHNCRGDAAYWHQGRCLSHPSHPRLMRVLTIARWYPSHDSPGRGSFVADLVDATARAGVDSRVVSFDRVLVRGRLEARDRALSEARAAYERVATPAALFVVPSSWGAPDVPVARLPMVRRPGTDDIVAEIDDHAAALEPFVRHLVRTWRPDVIHAHTGVPDGVVAADLGATLGIPVVVSEHMSTIESELADPIALERYRSLLRPGVALFAVSPALAGRVSRLLDVSSDRIGVLANAVDPEAFPLADPAARDRNELLWVGSLGEHKGIDVLLGAFASVRARRPGLRLRVVGGERAAGEMTHWQDVTASLGLADSVTFDGWADRASVATAMAKAGLFVHPSPSETFGVAAAEAILTGLPVVTRRSGGVPWVVEQAGAYGRVAADDSVEAFAAAIEAGLDGSFAVDARAARARLLEAVGSSAVASRAIEVYSSAIGAGERAPDAATPSTSTPVSPRHMPTVVVASGWDHGWRLVADLPAALRDELTLVVPSRPDGAAGRPVTGWIEAAPVPPPTRPPSGRSPITKLRRLLYRPAPTGEQLLGRAMLGAVHGRRSGRGPMPVVALDAPAAVLIDSLDRRQVVLAPGSLRWLADRWDAETAARR
jgi:glycosyltransferase involved in cell wall biosynthesis